MLTVQTAHLNMTSMKANAGFTLIEVLVAVVILALGLIGLAGLQATGLANNQSAYNRSQVSQLAYDIADRMRSNSGFAANYVLATAGGIPACPNGTYDNINPSSCTSCTTTATPCDEATMVTKDVFDWKLALRATVPLGDGAIVSEGANVYSVTIQWDDTKSGVAGANFGMRFRID